LFGEELMWCSTNAAFDIFDDDYEYEKRNTSTIDASDFILDIREYDVPYHVRVAIDKGWFAYILARGTC
jgi:DNA polymerase elongation subunit (family B)